MVGWTEPFDKLRTGSAKPNAARVGHSVPNLLSSPLCQRGEVQSAGGFMQEGSSACHFVRRLKSSHECVAAVKDYV